jgi:hypothetical protein
MLNDDSPTTVLLHGRAASQTGQALVLSIALVLMAGLMTILLFSSAQATSAKTRLNSTADAAAYSAAVWRARILNFEAYSNRAIIANEVAIAQAVTMVSWSKYFERLVESGATLSSMWPPLAAFFGAVGSAANTSRVMAENGAQLEIAARGAANIGYKNLLHTSQEILHLTGQSAPINMVTWEVAKANDPSFIAWVMPETDNYLSLTKTYSGPDRARHAQLVRDSLDPFVGGSRHDNLQLLVLSPGSCPLNGLVNPDRLFNWLRKRGTTVLSDNLERWESTDTMSFHFWAMRGFLGLGGCRERETVPLGWGVAEAADADSELSARMETNSADIRKNATAQFMGDSEIRASNQFGGIGSIRELDYDALTNTRYPSNQFTVVASVAAADLHTADKTNLGVGRFRLQDRLGNNRILSLSSAEVYFRRPVTATGAQQYASLFAPYWQARIVPVSNAHRLLAEAEYGG